MCDVLNCAMKLIYMYLKSKTDDDSFDKKTIWLINVIDLPVKGPRQTGQPFIDGWDLSIVQGNVCKFI